MKRFKIPASVEVDADSPEEARQLAVGMANFINKASGYSDNCETVIIEQGEVTQVETDRDEEE